MSKNIAFRRIDVDQYDDEKFKEDQSEQADVGPDQQEVNDLLSSGKASSALKICLQNPPVGTKNDGIKEKSAMLVLRVLSSIKSGEIASAIDSLSLEEVDVLMKYIYKGFGMGLDGQQCASILTWHDKVLQKGGKGCIVRVLSDRKRL